MKEYVNPHINFKKIEICERIADKCWGNHTSSGYIYFDYNNIKYKLAYDSSCSHPNDQDFINAGLPKELFDNQYKSVNNSKLKELDSNLYS